MPRAALLLLPLLLARAADEAPVRTVRLEARFAGSEASPLRQDLVLAGRERARWRSELPPAGPEARAETRILYLAGAQILEHRTEQDHSRALEGEELRAERVAFALAQALFLDLDALPWREVEGGRELVLELGLLRAAPAAQPREILLVREGEELGALREIEWRAPPPGGSARPERARLERAGRETLELHVLSLDDELRYVRSFFLPPDRRELDLARTGLDGAPQRAPLAERVEQRVPLPPRASWERALERERELRAAHARSFPGLALEPARLFELDRDGRPVAVLLRLLAPPSDAPAGFARHAPAVGLSRVLPGLDQLDSAALVALRLQRDGREELEAPFVRLPPHGSERPGAAAQLVLVLRPD